jgi:metallo-beta-lactamase class B
MRNAVLVFVLAFSVNALSAQSAPADTPAAKIYEDKAAAIAGTDLTQPLFLCRPDALNVVLTALKEGSKHWLEPTKAFDNLFFVGNGFVGVWIVKTSDGLILFDSGESTDEARDHLVPGIQQLGLDPRQIRYVIVTHAHWDHFGGAKYLHDTYGARVGLGAPDWVLLSEEKPGSLERGDKTPPDKDLVITDGQTLTLGDTTIKLYVTPGHTPGTVSALIPARENGKTYELSLLGSTAFPPTLEPTQRTGGLLSYDRSVKRLSDISSKADAVGILNTHIFVDGSAERLAAARVRKPGDPNPFLIGRDAVTRYYGILDECLQATETRPITESEWTQKIPAR